MIPLAPDADCARGPRLADEDGVTIVEVVVAALILLILSLGVMGVVDASTRNTYRAEQSQVVNNVLQGQMEQLKAIPYAQLGLDALPVQSSDPASPNARVSGANFDTSRSGPQSYSSLVSGGTVASAPSDFTSGGVKGKIYRYVVWQNDPSCPDVRCPGTQDYKLAIVSATLASSASGGTRRYQEIQSAINDPARAVACPVDGCPPGGGGNAKPWTFWLTDTTCNNSSRQPIVADHLAHNTRGTCAQGLKNGSNCNILNCPPGAPDLMYTEPAPLDSQYSSDDQPLRNYGTDTGSGSGLQPMNGVNCNTLGTLVNQIAGLGGLNNIVDLAGSNSFKQVHKWLSPPIPSGFNIVLTGDGTLNLWTKTATGASYPGRLCFWLFYRHNVLGLPVDTPALNVDLGRLNYFTYSRSPWPSGWEEIHIPLHFDLGVGTALNLLPNTQLGFAIGVDGTGTGAGGLQFMYDHPSFDSRLEVQTTSALPIF